MPHHVEEAFSLDHRPLSIASARQRQGPESSTPDREQLRTQYQLLCRLRNAPWQQPHAYRRFGQTDVAMALAAEGHPLSSQTRIPVREIPAVLGPVLDALRHLHALGFVKTDLSPACIFVDRSTDTPRITVAGLDACVASGSRARRGLLDYSSPEVMRHEVVLPTADLYSVGAVVVSLVSGRPPTPGPGRTWRDSFVQDLESDGWLDAVGRRRLETVVTTLLHPAPAGRFGSVLEVERALRRAFLRSGAGHAPPRPESDRATNAPRDELRPPVQFPWIPRETVEPVLFDWLRSLGEEAERTERTRPTEATAIEIVGERGTGVTEVATTLLDIAEVEGWLVDRDLPGTDRRARVGRIRSSALEPDVRHFIVYREWTPCTFGEGTGDEPMSREHASGERTESEGTTNDGTRRSENDSEPNDPPPLRLEVPLSERSELARLAALYVESDALSATLARASLGNPSLLAAIVGKIPTRADFLWNDHDAGFERAGIGSSAAMNGAGPFGSAARGPWGSDPEYDLLDHTVVDGPPEAWTVWCREQLTSLSDRDVEDVLRLAMKHWIPSATVGQATGAIVSVCADRGMLGTTGGVSLGLWAEALTQARPDLAGRLTSELLTRSSDDDPLRLAELLLRSRDPETIEALLPRSVNRLTSEERYFDAGRVFLRGLGLLTDPATYLASVDLAELVPIALLRGQALHADAHATAKLIDFGLGRPTEEREATQLLALLGTCSRHESNGEELLRLRPTAPRLRDTWNYLVAMIASNTDGDDQDQDAIPASRAHALVTATSRARKNLRYAAAELPSGWCEPDDPDRPALPPPLERQYLVIAAHLAWLRSDRELTTRLVSRAIGCSRDTLTPGQETSIHHLRASMAFGAGRQRECLHWAWSAIRTAPEDSAMHAANAATTALELGDLGQASRLIDAAFELIAEGSTRDTAQVRASCLLVLMRMGQFDRMHDFSCEPGASESGESPAMVVFAHAWRDLAEGQTDEGRRTIRSLIEQGNLRSMELAAILTDWALLELDLRHFDFTRTLLPELRDVANQSVGRTLDKIRLVSCMFELSAPGTPAFDLEAIIQATQRNLEDRDLLFYQCRATKNRALLYQRCGRRREEVSAWRASREALLHLLSLCRSEREARLFHESPGVQSFLADYHAAIEGPETNETSSPPASTERAHADIQGAGRVFGLDRRPLYVKVASTPSEAEELRAEYILARRLAGSTWQDPVAYRKYRTTEFMMTALADARSLAELPRPEIHEIPSIVFPILTALRRVHALGYTYVDLKPEHVFVDQTVEPTRVTLIDLGGCVPTGSEARMYTAGYSSPEAIGGGTVDERSDLYAFGAILAFLLTGEHQFRGESIREVLTQQFLGDPNVATEGPIVLEALVGDLLSATPSHRPRTTREVEQRLHQLWPQDLLEKDEARSQRLPTLPHDDADRQFLDWLDRIDSDRDATGSRPRRWRLTITGEPGIGRRRCASVWLAIAETRGWVPSLPLPVGTGAPSRSGTWNLLRCGGASEDHLDISLESMTKGEQPPPDEQPPHAELTKRTIEIGPLDVSCLERLASVQLESTRLRARLSRLSLGNPGLLATLLPRVSPICDFLNTGPITDDSYEEQGTPQLFIDWCQAAVASLPQTTRDSLIDEAVKVFLRPPPDSVLEPTGTPSGPRSPLERLSEVIPHALWSEAVLRVDRKSSTQRAIPLVGGRNVASTRLAPLCVVLGDDEFTARFIPTAVNRLLGEYRWRDAALAFGVGMNASSRPGRVLEQIDLQNLSTVLATHSTGATLSSRSKDALAEHLLGKSTATREAGTLLTSLGVKERDPSQSVLDLSGPRPTAPAAERSWLLYRCCHHLDLWRSRGTFDIGDDPDYVAMIGPRSHRIVGYNLREVGYRDDPNLPGPLRRQLLLTLAMNALNHGEYEYAAECTARIPGVCSDSLDPSTEMMIDQARAILAYEAGRAEDCRAGSWACLRSGRSHGMALLLANLALIDLDGGRLGSCLHLVARALESTRANSEQVSKELAQYNSYSLLQRLGQGDRVPPVPDDLTASYRSRAWLEADAHRLLSSRLHLGRTRIRALVDGESDPSERVDLLAEWILAEVDLGNGDFALGMANELNEYWESATDRGKMRVRLVTCALELLLPGPPSPDLERMIESNYDELARIDWNFYAWRAARNRAVYLEKAGRREDASEAWRFAHGLVKGLLASFSAGHAARAFEQTPAIQAFYHDSRRTGGDQ
ncbi:MAG: hypothetical protein KDA27_01205 [Candidatus Eisenbacteria bacterium]|uniref:Protein kinase domain-containing protein n=1 Tax=Eiseniibacteriota bacterium TaxID=2212470 RepID=A0A956N7Y1_UNCEI|nr:hypothetical protein [Candidatus Eisenbacteria bacterium]MCB9466256.1 hypothetical protein [Candidatus Eisenbacteria bacterium]